MNTNIILANKLLEFNDNLPLGLAYGKMGICIYFFILGEAKNNKKYMQHAENMLDDVFINIDQIQSIDILNGITGIGLGVEYLISNNYVKGSINKVLAEIDNVVCKNFGYEENYIKLSPSVVLHLLFLL